MHSNEEGKWVGDGGRDGVPIDASRTTAMTAVEALPDAELLAGTRRLVCQSNRDLAALLAHLAEVEARGLHRTRACASLYSYCIYELRISEDAAYRRVGAARLVKRFPLLLGALERGELHLTGLLQLGPHLTDANLLEVLARAQFRTKKEIEKLVRLLSPLPDVPSRIEPLGLDRPRPRATWGNLLAGRHPVRELPPDERPENWLPAPTSDSSSAPARSGAHASDGVEAVSLNDALVRIHATTESPAALLVRIHAMTESSADAPARTNAMIESSADAPARIHATTESFAAAPARFNATAESSAAAPARIEDSETRLAGPQRYKVQFTASEEYVALVEEAKALLAHASPDADIAEIHLRAMRTLLAELKKRKYSHSERRVATASPSAESPDNTRFSVPNTESPSRSARQCDSAEPSPRQEAPEPCQRDAAELSPQHDAAEPPRQRDPAESSPRRDATEPPRQRDPAEPSPRYDPADPPRRREAAPSSHQQGRHVPAAVRREVFARDGQRCAYLDARGVRCRETRRLEIHHHLPFARGGAMTPENLSLYCSAHNALAAERDFGREFSREKRESHAPFSERTLTRANAPIG